MTRTARLMMIALMAAPALSLLSSAEGGAWAAEVTFAPGSHVGLVTIKGLRPAKTFPGFEDPDKGVKVLTANLPPAAFTSVEAALAQKPLPPAIAASKPERIETNLGPAYLSRESSEANGVKVSQFVLIAGSEKMSAVVTAQIPDTAKDYSDAAVRQMFTTVALRPEVPVEEQLALLPFKVNDLGGFKTVRTLAPGQAILLSDGAADAALDHPSSVVISVAPGGPAQNDERARFAQQMIESVPGLKDARITASEPMRMGGLPGFESRMDAVMARTDTPVTLVQWLRFGSGGYIRILGAAPRSDWNAIFPRLRAVRDGIELR